ncbi:MULTISPECIES: hypothetical protein [unclassified Microbacterium]|uniref:hypothetical protein n=1 Tax=unclassified Microbacterium TaxID=2609290 RepID=UPI00300FC35A
MPIVSGTLSDVMSFPLADRAPILRFHLRTEVGDLALRGDRLLSADPVDATITGTDWQINIFATTGNIPPCWYELELIELDREGNFSRHWWWGSRIHVPSGGGSFPELPGGPMSPESVWVGLTRPPNGWRGYWLYSPSTQNGEVMPLDDPDIGSLRRAQRG